jgi:hypothetical protein
MTDEIRDRVRAALAASRVARSPAFEPIACACMGRKPGHVLCPCQERRFIAWLSEGGYAIVRRRATRDMILEGSEYSDFEDIWDAMLAAAEKD